MKKNRSSRIKNMKTCVSSYSFSKYMKETGCDLIAVATKAKELGFDAIEFTELPGDDKIALAKKLRAHCDEIGLPIAAHSLGADFINHDTEAEIKRVCEAIDVAAILGAGSVRHDVCYALKADHLYSYREAIKEMAPAIRRITEYGASKGIRTTTENHGYIFQDPERVEALILAVGHENYGWLCDIGNFLCADCDVVRAVSTAAPYTYHVHVKDFLMKSGAFDKPEGFFDTRGGNYLRGTILGHGEVPVATAIKALKRAGYDGYVSLEFEGMEENIPALEAGLSFLKKVIA
jgi:sugar phosphate isomerase/epimerase